MEIFRFVFRDFLDILFYNQSSLAEGPKTAALHVDPNDGRAINLNVSIVDENIEAGGHN